MPQHHTHLENVLFEIEYIKLIQDSFPLMLSCWNVTLRSHVQCRNVILRSYNTVLEHDTPILLSH